MQSEFVVRTSCPLDNLQRYFVVWTELNTTLQYGSLQYKLHSLYK